MRIEDIDPNFKFETIKEEDIEWISSLDERFSLYGVYYDEEEKSFVRMPQDACSHSRAIPSFPSQLEWKIGLAWANTRGSLNSPS